MSMEMAEDGVCHFPALLQASVTAVMSPKHTSTTN